jgi:hypothetical protein
MEVSKELLWSCLPPWESVLIPITQAIFHDLRAKRYKLAGEVEVSGAGVF